MKTYEGNAITPIEDYQGKWALSPCGNVTDSNFNGKEGWFIVEPFDQKYQKYVNGVLIEDNSKRLSDYKIQKVEELKQLHITFMNKPFKITIERDDLTSISFWLNCTDETANNVAKALDAARLEGGIYFYNGGTDADLSVAEMEKVVRGFNAVCLPSFRIKGENKLAINAATSIEQIDTIMASVQF